MDRKEEILKILSGAQGAIKGSDLAGEFNVTRQVIVQDIALLRAEGQDIIATNRGYLLARENGGLRKSLVCQHHGYDEMEKELNIIVDHGARVKDVIIDHPVYGEIKTSLELDSRKDVRDFLNIIRRSEAEPLSRLTEGVHIHTIECKDESSFQELKDALSLEDFLLE